MNLNLLDKLASINVQPTDKLSKEDKAFLNKLKTNYANVVDQLAAAREVVNIQITANHAEDYYEWDVQDESVNKIGDSEKTWGWDNMFSFKYNLKHIIRLFFSVKIDALNEIIDYFNTTYSLRLSHSDYRDLPSFETELLKIDDVVDWVLTQIGGLSLNEMSVKLLKDDFTKVVNNRGTSWRNRSHSLVTILSNNSLTFPQFISYYQSDRLHWSDSDNRNYNKLLLALLYFEDGSTQLDYDKISTTIPYSHTGYRFTFTEAYLTKLSKVESLRFYGNGKIIVKFKTATLASEFAAFYSMELASKA